VRIQNLDPFDAAAVWPKNIEICITRLPIRKRDGYSIENVQKFAERLKPCMAKNGVAFIICYAPTEAKGRPFEVANEMAKVGFNHIDNIVIEKSWFPGKRSEINLVNSHEFVFYFCNGEVWKLDRLPIRAYLGTGDDVTCPGNTWKIKTGSLDEAYSVDLAELLLRMTDSLPGSLIFDPYLGTSAPILASLKLGHSFYGFERDAKKMVKYDKLIKDWQNGKIK
jgi:hypothetical protein